MPISNLAAAASDLALSQSVRYVCHRSRCRWRPNYVYRPQAYYGYGPSYYSYGPSYYSYAPSYFGYGGGSGGSYRAADHHADRARPPEAISRA